jgi:aminoglycoside phosphotransferase (APT) family kinase protein
MQNDEPEEAGGIKDRMAGLIEWESSGLNDLSTELVIILRDELEEELWRRKQHGQ